MYSSCSAIVSKTPFNRLGISFHGSIGTQVGTEKHQHHYRSIIPLRRRAFRFASLAVGDLRSLSLGAFIKPSCLSTPTVHGLPPADWYTDERKRCVCFSYIW